MHIITENDETTLFVHVYVFIFHPGLLVGYSTLKEEKTEKNEEIVDRNLRTLLKRHHDTDELNLFDFL